MSVTQMQATLKKHIAEALQDVLKSSSGVVTERSLKSIQDSYLSTEAIRSQTDPKSDSIFSRAGLASLQNDMLQYYSNIQYEEISQDVIKSLNYDDFKEYVLQQYYGKEAGSALKAQKLRSDPNFNISERLRATGSRKGTTLEVFTSKIDAERDVLIFKNIDYDKIVMYFTEYMMTKIITNRPVELKKYIKGKLLNAGHLAGIFNARLLRTFGARTDNTGQIITRTNSSELENLLQTLVNLTSQADYLSSNIIQDVSLFEASEKQLTKRTKAITTTTEVQLAFANQAAGDLLKQAGSALSKLIAVASPNITVKDKEIQKRTLDLIKKLKDVQLFIRKRVNELRYTQDSSGRKIKVELKPEVVKKLKESLTSARAIETLIQSKGSYSLVEYIALDFISDLTGKPLISQNTKASAKVQGKPKKVNTKKVASATVKKIDKITATIKKTASNRAQQTIPNLSNLQNLLNQRLHDQIRANMGTGSSKNVLNYRSGRFAESARVERLSLSREGMIQAFYTYMKNPYATFSQGGRQEFPRSRDPKLLISRSIREIAQTTVTNRLRAINV